jgi:hypothetical protein
MKIHLAWIRMTAAAAIVAGAGAHPAVAQYAPYRPLPAQPAAPQTAAAPAAQNPYPTYTAYRPQPQPPRVGSPQYQAYQPTQPAPATLYPQTAAPYASYSQYPQTTAPTGQYSTAYGSYPYVAQQPTEAMPAPDRGGAANAAPNNGAPAASPANGASTNGAAATGTNGYAAGDVYGAGSCGCNGAAGTCGANGAYSDYGISHFFTDSCSDTQWFGGVYFLWMNRDQPSPVKLMVEVDHAVAPDPYYPQGQTTVLSSHDVDFDFREGVEARVGSTFTIGDSCDACSSGYGGCNSCGPTCGPSCPGTTYAWEVAWWGLNDDTNEFVFQDQPTTRIYGMKNFVGVEYDRDGGGAGYVYRPVNEYYDYSLPISAPPGVTPDGYVAVLAQRVRTDFKAQNLELNIIRFPMTCESSCGGCGGCDTCGCNGGYNACGCEDKWNVHFSMYGSCGVRYFRVDDMFSYDTEFAEYSAGAGAYDQAAYNGFTYDNSNELCYDIDVKNQLVGPQVGWTTNYAIGCKWNLFCNSTFGIFNNHINSFQRMWSGGGGDVRFSGDGSNFAVNSSKDDVSFLGELRLGGSYDLNCHWRAVAAYRAVAITGLATSTAQIPNDFTNKEYVAIIDSDNSMIVHGVQVGTECRY